MRTPVLDLLRYVHALRSDFFEASATLGWTGFAKDRGVSLGSFRNLFLHLAYVEEHHVTQFCEGKATVWPYVSEQVSRRRYRTFDEVRERLRSVAALAEERFGVWDNERALGQEVAWVRLGHPIRLAREQALTQCTTEHLLHLGEIEAMLWQADIEPPTTLWIDRMVLHGRPPAPPPVRVLRRIRRDGVATGRFEPRHRGPAPPRDPTRAAGTRAKRAGSARVGPGRTAPRRVARGPADLVDGSVRRVGTRSTGPRGGVADRSPGVARPFGGVRCISSRDPRIGPEKPPAGSQTP